MLEPFSHQEPVSLGQNPVVLKVVDKIFELTGNRGVLVVDPGFDAGVMFEDWLQKVPFRCLAGWRSSFIPLFGRFWVRQRWTVGPDWGTLAGWANRHCTSFLQTYQGKGKLSLQIAQVGWVEVRLPGRDENLPLVVSRLAECDKSLMLLTNRPVENLKDAKRVPCYRCAKMRMWKGNLRLIFSHQFANITV